MLRQFKYLAPISILILATGLLSGCGKKGDLFLPPSTNTTQIKQSSDTEKKPSTSEQQPANSVNE
ncbi:MAG: lipoprotein [Gammaproteobacteria bacterium]|nr:lipoprotein [Gammaproteobacteria bacterium]